MKATLDKTVLSAALVRCAPAVGRSPGRDGGFVRLVVDDGTLTLAAYDGDLMISASVDGVEGDNGSCLLPSRLGSQVLGSLGNGEATVIGTNDGATIEMGRSTFELATPSVDAAFSLPVLGGAPQEIDASALCDACGQVTHAASTDLARSLLTGVLLQVRDDGLRLAATDSYRLAVCDIPGRTLALPSDAVLPSRALAEVTRVYSAVDGALTVRVSDGMVSFAANGTVIATRLIDGQYPDYERLLPATSETTFVGDVEPAVDALQRMALIRGNATGATVMELSDGGAQLATRVPERGEAHEWLDGELTGAPLTVGCNPAFLADAIQHTGTEQFSLACVDASKPIKVTGMHDGRYLALVMPVRMS